MVVTVVGHGGHPQPRHRRRRRRASSRWCIFARRVAHFTEVVDVAHPDGDTRVYAVTGELFFASSNDLVYQFDYAGDPQQRRHRPERRPHLGRLHRRRPRRHRAEVPPQRARTSRSSGSTRPARPGTALWPGSSAGPLTPRATAADPRGGAPADRRGGRTHRAVHPHDPALRRGRPGHPVGPQRWRLPPLHRADVERLQMIRRMKPLGFTLEEMHRLLDSLAVLADPAANPRQPDRPPRSSSPTATPGPRTPARPWRSSSATPLSSATSSPTIQAAPDRPLRPIVQPTVKVTP